MDFVIDIAGDVNNENPILANNSITKQLLQEYKESLQSDNIKTTKKRTVAKSINDDFNLFSGDIKFSKSSKTTRKANNKKSLRKKYVEEVLKKSVLSPDFESLHSVPPYEVSRRRLKKEKQKEREKTKGKKWYGLPATEMTEEIKNDLEVLQMRSAIDPKHFYKKNDLKVLPKYFQIGKVLDSPLDHYNNRLTKKQRKRTLVDELLADAEFCKYNKRKYKEIIEEKQKTDYKAWRKSRKAKKKNQTNDN